MHDNEHEQHRRRAMTTNATGVQHFTPKASENTARFGDGISITPGLAKESGQELSTYAAHFRSGSHAELPAPYAEIWVVISGTIRVGDGTRALTVGAGEYVHIPEQTPGSVEAIEDTTMVCVSVPAH
jgi:quercetin dioxygenase-like cupin family protein